MKIFYCMTLVGLFSQIAFSQTQVEVVTKSITEEFTTSLGYSLKIEGNAANISVKSWDRNLIRISLKLISKGLTRAVAKQELNYHKYAIDKLKKQIIVRNYMLLPSNVNTLTTIQEATIELMIPTSMDLQVVNVLGNTTLNEVSGTMEIASQYGNVKLVNCKGKIDIESTYGELDITHFIGDLTAKLEHTSSKVQFFSGSAVLSTNLGDVEWREAGDLSRITMDMRKSDLEMNGVSFDSYYWKLKTKFGEIITPEEGLTGSKITYGNVDMPLIEITSDFGKITIEE